MYKLDNWAVHSTNDNPYYPPDAFDKFLSGEVSNHPKYQDGSRIRTSWIEKVHGRYVTTSSGSVYVLANPHPDYVKWMNENNIEYNPDKPIRIVGGS